MNKINKKMMKKVKKALFVVGTVFSGRTEWVINQSIEKEVVDLDKIGKAVNHDGDNRWNIDLYKVVNKEDNLNAKVAERLKELCEKGDSFLITGASCISKLIRSKCVSEIKKYSHDYTIGVVSFANVPEEVCIRRLYDSESFTDDQREYLETLIHWASAKIKGEKFYEEGGIEEVFLIG